MNEWKLKTAVEEKYKDSSYVTNPNWTPTTPMKVGDTFIGLDGNKVRITAVYPDSIEYQPE